uniref:EGF-like domain-containing protein n=1 Tax=Panagrolaimus davidi TaxID=227884 RepID=A0A914QJY6_9BILA
MTQKLEVFVRYSGSLCETEIPNACDTKICINGRCRLDGSTDKGICECFYGFEGENCDTKTLCDPASCSGHGTCSSNINNGTSINCLCDSGWNGERCDIDVNECKKDAKLCKHGTCVNSLGSYFCRCFDGYVGVHCKKEASNGCSSMPCQNGGTCLSTTGSDFTCKCPPGFTGNLCEENINDCERYDDPNFGDAGKNLSKCTNGGSCIDGINEFYCVCPNGFTGKDCRQNIDECNIYGSGLCKNGGSCIDIYGTFQCACIYGFEGKYCEINVNDCEDNLCYNGSKCIDKIRSYECECETDRIGVFCQFENPCIEKNNKCQNGQCFADSTNGNFSCFCDKGFSVGFEIEKTSVSYE